jgi:hydrogenase expression/formation protein HypC
VLTAENAARINAALQALDMAMQGETGIDHLFSDLIDREPTLPDFLSNPSNN